MPPIYLPAAGPADWQHLLAEPAKLLHRTASALIEARRFHARAAVLLIHSFSPSGMWYADYAAFAALLGVDGAPGALVDAGDRDGVRLFLGWVRGGQRFLEA